MQYEGQLLQSVIASHHLPDFCCIPVDCILPSSATMLIDIAYVNDERHHEEVEGPGFADNHGRTSGRKRS